MGFYSKVIFPRFYDCLMDKPFWAKYRIEQLAGVHGEILEIGVGTGLNLPHYPDHVHRIVTVDPNPGMNKKLQQRIDQCGSSEAAFLSSDEEKRRLHRERGLKLEDVAIMLCGTGWRSGKDPEKCFSFDHHGTSHD